MKSNVFDLCFFQRNAYLKQNLFSKLLLGGGGGGLEEILKLWFGFYGRFVVRLDCSIEDA